MRCCQLCCWFLMMSFFVDAQGPTENVLRNSPDVRREMAERSILKEYPARNIGPTVQGGRIVDLDVNQKNTKEFYVAYASGGIFKTTNNGITFQPVFDNVGALGIGDMALSQSDPQIIYVGTGEKNSSRSSYAGSGVYKSTDAGKSWQHLGLAETHHIGRVVIHPQNNNIVWVASIGALYSHNPERGVYKSTDGGTTWKKTLFINDSTGVIDVIVNPRNPQQLWASSWERTRKSWHFKGNGPGSTIYRSDDGGETWTQAAEGLPEGPLVGRIGIEIAASNPNIIYAVLDNQGEVADEKTKKSDPAELKLMDFKTMTKEALLKMDNKKLDEFLKDKNFPEKYTAEIIKKEVAEGKYTPREIAAHFSGDANAEMINTKIIGAEIYRSDDSGNSWKKMNSYDLDGVFHSYGYYFSEMKVSPDDPDLIYVYGVPLLKSRDGGVTFHRIDTLKGIRHIHIDHHALWIDRDDPDHMLLGNDGGLYQSYDEGATWLHINNMPVGQFYTVNVDMETPYNVYGGMQDNGVYKGSGKSIPNETKHWHQIFWGDGMFVAPDPRNSKLVYTGYQFGNYFRFETHKGEKTKITPQHDIGEQPLRWNWRAPLILSKHNPDIVYIAANKIYRSMDQGDSWEPISPDLTKSKPYGNVPFSTISSLAESPLKFGLLYAGTDDGNVMVSHDGGTNWSSISEGLPPDKWVSSISPSPTDEATVFISLNGYRDDNFSTWLFSSSDYGKTWKSVKGNLPESAANIIIQDPVNENLLYCGLDNGTHVSLDKGNTWNLFNQMLNAPSYDMVVHPRENELVVATHGRSVFVADVKPLQTLKNGAVDKSIVAFPPETIKYSELWGEKRFPWDAVNTPEMNFLYYAGMPSANIAVEIYDEKNNLVRKLNTVGSKGFHVFKWDVKIQDVKNDRKKFKNKAPQPGTDLKYAMKGKYKGKFINGSDTSEVAFEIK